MKQKKYQLSFNKKFFTFFKARQTFIYFFLSLHSIVNAMIKITTFHGGILIHISFLAPRHSVHIQTVNVTRRPTDKTFLCKVNPWNKESSVNSNSIDSMRITRRSFSIIYMMGFFTFGCADDEASKDDGLVNIYKHII